MMWWYGHVFVNRNNPQAIIVAPKPDTGNPPKERKLMLKINLFFAFLKGKFTDYTDLRETRRVLKPLDDHMLHDIGLSRTDWHALMEGEAVARKQVLARLPRRSLPVHKVAAHTEVLPEELPKVVKRVVTNQQNASNDCAACAA